MVMGFWWDWNGSRIDIKYNKRLLEELQFGEVDVNFRFGFGSVFSQLQMNKGSRDIERYVGIFTVCYVRLVFFIIGLLFWEFRVSLGIVCVGFSQVFDKIFQDQ